MQKASLKQGENNIDAFYNQPCMEIIHNEIIRLYPTVPSFQKKKGNNNKT